MKERKDRASKLGQSFNPELLQDWNDQGYKVEFHGQDISVLIFGESHYEPKLDFISERKHLVYFELLKKQIELMRLVRPEYVLHEAAEAWIYDPVQKMWVKQEDREFDEFADKDRLEPLLPREFLSASEEIGFKIIGCDLTYGECREAAGRLLGHVPLTLAVETLEQIMRCREAQMVKTIAKYQRESRRPIIVILGAVHGRRIHRRRLTRQNKFGYAYIDQVTWYEW